MTIADDLIDQLQRLLGRGRRPAVRALHLPPTPWNGSKDGEFGALELDDGSLGLSYVLLDGTRQALSAPAASSTVHIPGRADPAASGDRGAARIADADRRVVAGASAQQGPPPRGLVGADAMAVARRWRDGNGAERAIGFAAVNALSRHIFDRAGLVPPEATDSIGGLDPQPGEHIGMVGYFPPLVKQVIGRGARLTVLELRPDLAGARAGFDITLDPRALRGCDKVLSTSTVLLNDTLDAVLAQCGHARAFAMIGPGAGCLPDALFARGVSVVGGAWIEDAAAFIAALRSGQPWGRHARKFAWQLGSYPGLR